MNSTIGHEREACAASRIAGRVAAMAFLAAALTLALPHGAAAQSLRLTAPEELAVPSLEDLRARLERTLRQPYGAKIYALEGGKLVEVQPPPPFARSSGDRALVQRQGSRRED